MKYILEAGSSAGKALPEVTALGVAFNKNGRLLLNHGSLTIGAEPAADGRIRLVGISFDGTETPTRRIVAEIQSPMPRSAVALGNFLVLLCPDGMRFLRRFNDSDGLTSYSTIGFGPQAPEMEFRLVREPMAAVQAPIEVDLGNAETADIVGKRIERGSALSLAATGRSAEAVANLTDAVNAALNKAVDCYATSLNRFCEPFMVRYALRLYDGTSVCQSAPVLMMPSAGVQLLTAGNLRVDPDTQHLHGGVGLEYMNRCRLEMRIRRSDDGDSDLLKALFDEGVVRSVEVAVTRPIATFSQNAPVTGYHTVQASVVDGLTGQRPGAGGSDGNGDTESFESIFTGHYSEWDTAPCCEHFLPGDQMLGTMVWAVKGLSAVEQARAVTAANVFYVVASLSHDALSPFYGRFAELPIEHNALSTLALRRTMPDGFEPLNRRIADVAVAFNSRLNIVPQSICYTAPQSIAPFLPFSGDEPASSGAPMVSVKLNVKLRKAGGDIEVASAYAAMQADLSRPPRWLFYPDADAVAVTLSVAEGDSAKEIEIPLTPHPTLNGAYFFGGFASGCVGATIAGGRKPGPEEEVAVVQPVEPVLLTSALNCPFVFPVENAVKLPGDKAEALLTAIQPMSEGQFGHFPLYVFMRHGGIYVLDNDGTGRWHTLRQVAWHGEASATVAMNGGVMFVTRGGVMCLRGMSMTRLDESGVARYGTELLQRLPGFERIAVSAQFGGLSQVDVYPVAANFSALSSVYDNSRHLLILYRQSESVFAHVWNPATATWSLLHQRVQWTDAISTPGGEIVAVGADSMLYGLSETERPRSLLVTEPMWGSGAVATRFGSLIVRGEPVRRDDSESVTLYGSRDYGENWFAVASEAGRCLHRVGGSPWRDYVAVIVSGAKRIFAVEKENC